MNGAAATTGRTRTSASRSPTFGISGTTRRVATALTNTASRTPTRPFDVAIATSVFTHLLEGEADHYLAEVARILVPGGRLLATFFLLDDDSRAAIADGRALVPFPVDRAVAALNPDLPEDAVAHDRGWLEDALDRHHFALDRVAVGSWRGKGQVDGQDVVVARNREPDAKTAGQGQGPPRRCRFRQRQSARFLARSSRRCLPATRRINRMV